MARRTQPPRGTETLLLVDDEADVRDALGQLLRQLGYRVYLAASALEALALIEQVGDQLDLLISDVVMPGMDGLQLATRARQLHPDLPILLISGYADGAVTGVRDSSFLRKPFSLDELAAEVRNTLTRGADPEGRAHGLTRGNSK